RAVSHRRRRAAVPARHAAPARIRAVAVRLRSDHLRQRHRRVVHQAGGGAVFLFVCALFTAETPHMVILTALFIGGFFRSLQFTCMGTLGYAEVPPEM